MEAQQRQAQQQAHMQEQARRQQREQQSQPAQQQQQQSRPDSGQQQHPTQSSTPQQQQVQQQQVQHQQIQQAQLQQQQQRQVMLQNQMQNSMPRSEGPFILRLYQFSSDLSQQMASPRSSPNGRLDGPNQASKSFRDMKHLQRLVDNYFSLKGMLRQALWSSGDESTKQFEIPTAAVARYYWSQFNSGVKNIQMFIEGAVERRFPNGGCFVESPRCTIVYWFANGHEVSLLNSVSNPSLTSHSLCQRVHYEHNSTGMRNLIY